MRFPRLLLLHSLLPLLLGASACNSFPELGNDDAGNSNGEGTGGNGSGTISVGEAGSSSGGTTTGGGKFDLKTLAISGPDTLDLFDGEAKPTATFKATVSGKTVSVGWSVDRGDLGTISDQGVFTPKGDLGGWVTIRAGLEDKVVEKRLFISVVVEQNGPKASDSAQIANSAAELSTGGGIGGVGGEGLGGKISDADLIALLASGATDAGTSRHLELLYPYDGTVFPRGMLAPLLMWRWDTNDADAIRIDLETASGSFRYSGTFGRPAILATTGRAFLRHPIPASIWRRASDSAGEALADGSSDTLSVKISIAEGGVVYGPLTRTFGIAPGRLSGTVYYNSYGTGLVENFQHTRNGQPNNFGAAVLGIRSGETGPTLVSGYDSANHNGCRVCHTVSAQGSNLLVQGGGSDRKSWWRDLLTSTESYLTGQDSIFAWAGLSPDGKFALTNAVDVSKHNTTVDGTNFPYSELYDMTTTPPVLVNDSDLPANFKAALPTFSPDGKKVAFAYLGGTGAGVPGGLATDGSQLAAMDFNPTTKKFSNFRVIGTGHTDQAANYRAHGAGWPSFTPTSTRVIFENELRGANSNETYIGTRDGARGELWWTDSETTQMKRLNYLNGRDGSGTTYLPSGPNKHGTGDGSYDDSSLAYEPTVAPVVSGGYAWVVFTSRRMYGNLATQDPWLSDPRNYDFKDYDQITTKKLWVAAVRVGASADEDPSYPAFYLPGQELVAGNARGYWVLDPCHDDGDSCETGDQCCGGFCQPNGKDGELVCSNTTTTLDCAQAQEKCNVAADCCDPGAKCTGGFCAKKVPVIPR